MNVDLTSLDFYVLSITMGILFAVGQELFGWIRRSRWPIQRRLEAERIKQATNSRNVARRLLEEHLNPRQLSQWKSNGTFTVTGSRSRRTYHITLHGVYSGSYSYCLVTDRDRVPLEDSVLIRKLLIETDEPTFLSTAKRMSGL